MNRIFFLSKLFGGLLASAIIVSFSSATAYAQHEHGGSEHKAGSEVTVTGEVLDMACYLGHGAMGPDHADCAKTCIKSGVPVGLKGTDGKTYFLIGEHKPANKELVQYAAKTITVRGKLAERDGIAMLSNIEILKK